VKVKKGGILFQRVQKLADEHKALDQAIGDLREARGGQPVVKGASALDGNVLLQAVREAASHRRQVEAPRPRKPTTTSPPQVKTKSGYNFTPQNPRPSVDQSAIDTQSKALDDEQRRLKKELLLRKIEAEQADRDGPDGGGEIDSKHPVEEKMRYEEELQLQELQLQQQLQKEEQELLDQQMAAFQNMPGYEKGEDKSHETRRYPDSGHDPEGYEP
jgi:hypothetical protein